MKIFRNIEDIVIHTALLMDSLLYTPLVLPLIANYKSNCTQITERMLSKRCNQQYTIPDAKLFLRIAIKRYLRVDHFRKRV